MSGLTITTYSVIIFFRILLQKQRFVFISILLLVAFVPRLANALNVERVDEIPRNDINCTYEDRKGFVWVATLDGLYRYDGHECRVYLPGENEGTISSTMVLVVDEDQQGNIWVGTYGQGISMLDPRSGKFRNYSLSDIFGEKSRHHDIVSIEIDRQNNIWIGTIRNFGRLELDGESLDIVKFHDYSGCVDLGDDDPTMVISKIFEDRAGNMWVGCSNGVYRVVEELEGELVTERFDLSCYDMCDYNANSILVGGSDITPIEMEVESGKYNIGERISKQNSSSILYNQGAIWSGNRVGLSKMKCDNTGEWHVLESITQRSYKVVKSSIVSSLMVSKSNQLWVSTRGGGLYVVDEEYRPFNNYPVTERQGSISSGIKKSLYEDSHGGLWIGTDGDGIEYVAAGGDYNSGCRSIDVREFYNRAYEFAEGGADGVGRNIMWVGVPPPRYLVAYDIKTLREIVQPDDIPKLGFVYSLLQTDRSTLWAGTYNSGLWRLSVDGDGRIVGWKHFTAYNKDTQYGLSSNTIRSLCLDSRGDLWVATDVGVNRVASSDLSSDEPQFLKTLGDRSYESLMNEYVLQVVESSSGELYFGTMGGGVIRYDPATDNLLTITDRDGLANNTIKSIVEHKESGSIWVATNSGLTKYTPSTNTLINYGHDQGIQYGEFSERCGVVRRDGTLLFGNSRGLVAFDPMQMPVSEITPTLFFTGLEVNNRPVEVGASDGILSQSMELTNSITLDYEERNFTINFVGINLGSRRGNKYRYRLYGYDREWSLITNDKLSASYTNMPAGRYTFSVETANSDDVWSERKLNLEIYIRPPFYSSGSAYLFYMVFFVFVGYVIFWVTRLRYLKRRDQEIAKLEQVRLEELMQYKLDFFMNVSHEFRTPLTLISLPLESSLEVARISGNRELKGNLELAKRNVAVLKKLVNELLDFRKVEEGKQPIRVEPCDIGSFITPCYELFVPSAQSRDVDYCYTPKGGNIVVDIDKRLFEKVLLNLLSNAFKHTPKGGRISISVELESERDRVLIVVEDNGRGVDSQSLDLLFEQFYQGENANAAGSGIGLSLCKGVVELHGGVLSVESEIGEGFRATVELPHSQSECSVHSDYTLVDKHSALDYVNSELQSISPSVESVPLEMELGRSTILIVEDNGDLRRELVNNLGRDYNVVEAENGEVGVVKCRKHYPDLVITDIMMPVMDGIEMCRVIKGDEDISHTPILVLTANASVKSKIDSFTIGGAEAYLDKPFDMAILRSHVEATLRNRLILQDRFQRQSIISPDTIAQTPADVKFLSQIIAIVKDDIANSDLNVELIAQRYGVSRTYLNRKIKALTGDTSIMFLRRIRLKYAATLLTQGDLNVNEVAWEVGYNDVNTFRLRFKEMYGVSPTNYKG